MQVVVSHDAKSGLYCMLLLLCGWQVVCPLATLLQCRFL
jgi:hypothetical protein